MWCIVFFLFITELKSSFFFAVSFASFVGAASPFPPPSKLLIEYRNRLKEVDLESVIALGVTVRVLHKDRAAFEASHNCTVSHTISTIYKQQPVVVPSPDDSGVLDLVFLDICLATVSRSNSALL